MKKSLIIIALMLASMITTAQIYIPIYTWHDYKNNIRFSGMLRPPLTPYSNADPGSMYYNSSDSSFYLWTGYQWKKSGSDFTLPNLSDGYRLYVPGEGLRSLMFSGNWGFLDTVGTPGKLRIGITPQVGWGLNVDGFTDEVYADSTRGTGLPTYHYIDSVAGSTITNALGSGDTLLTADNKIKRIDHDATITVSTNASKLLFAVDTISHVSTPFKLKDTAAALRAEIIAATDTTRGTGIPTYHYVDSLKIIPFVGNRLTRSGNIVSLGGSVTQEATTYTRPIPGVSSGGITFLSDRYDNTLGQPDGVSPAPLGTSNSLYVQTLQQAHTGTVLLWTIAGPEDLKGRPWNNWITLVNKDNLYFAPNPTPFVMHSLPMYITPAKGSYANITTAAKIGSTFMVDADSIPVFFKNMRDTTVSAIHRVMAYRSDGSTYGVAPSALTGTTVINLGYTASPAGGQVTNSSGGTSASIPLATTTNAGLQSPEDKEKLNQNTYFYNGQSGVSMDSTLTTPNDSTFLARQHHITAGSNKVSIDSSEDTESFTDIIDINESNLNLANIGGTLPLSKVATIANNTFLGNISGSTAAPSATAFTSITSLGTIGTGTWQGTVISPTYGGTGVNNGSKTLTLSGNTIVGSSTHTVSLLTTGNTSVSLPTGGAIPNYSETSTTTSSSIGPTGNARDNYLTISALASDLTISAPTGTPAHNNWVTIEIKDDGTPRALTWNSVYKEGDIPLPDMTIAGKVAVHVFKYSTTISGNGWLYVGQTGGF